MWFFYPDQWKDGLAKADLLYPMKKAIVQAQKEH